MNRLSGYEESVWSTRLVSRLVDFWPLENKNFLQLSYRAVPIVLIVGLLTVPQVRRLYKFRKDLNAVIEVLSTGILMEIISLLKLIGAWYNRPGIIIIFHHTLAESTTFAPGSKTRM